MDSNTHHCCPDRTESGGAPENSLTGLVNAAKQGDTAAWNALVRRYRPLVTSVTRQFRLSTTDAEDVGQVVWLRLLENLDRLREDCAIPGWIRTTTRNEALRVVKSRQRFDLIDPGNLAWMDVTAADDEVDRDLLRSEREQAVRDGLAHLDHGHRELLLLLHAEQRPNYQAISRALGMPTGSIGPTRARCLERLRKTDAVRRFVGSDTVRGRAA